MLDRRDLEPVFFAPFVSSVMRVEPSWIDYNGVEQSAPTIDTRGVKLADGTRVYVDVYPEASF